MAAAGDTRPLEAIVHGLTDETIGWFHDDMDALGALRPTHAPRATAWIGPMVAMIRTLIDRGHAYAAQGHVLFRVRSYARYGALSGRSVDDMIAGARVEVAPFKEDPMDFVLWKPSTPDQPGWESPWGRGRPGWHIECSAMAHALLGESFDIHAGGIDLQFPHHENEIAQSACAHPHGEFARVWLHNEMLQVEGKKMSKSLGNFFTVRDLLDKGVPGEVIRYVMLMTHYRKPMDWTEAKRRAAQEALGGFASVTVQHRPTAPDPRVVAAVSDDLNTPAALAVLHELARSGDAGALLGSLNLLGIDLSSITAFRDRNATSLALADWTERLTRARAEAVERKDFTEVDRLKRLLTEAGLEVRMSKQAVDLLPGPDFDPSRLESLP
jgi:cysteinyl-tRNA synthetase